MYIDSELTDTVGGASDGNRAPATKLNANLGPEWDVPAASDLTLTPPWHVQQFAIPELGQHSWTRYDIGARYAFKVDDKEITLRGSVENVFDNRDWISAGASRMIANQA